MPEKKENIITKIRKYGILGAREVRRAEKDADVTLKAYRQSGDTGVGSDESGIRYVEGIFLQAKEETKGMRFIDRIGHLRDTLKEIREAIKVPEGDGEIDYRRLRKLLESSTSNTVESHEQFVGKYSLEVPPMDNARRDAILRVRDYDAEIGIKESGQKTEERYREYKIQSKLLRMLMGDIPTVEQDGKVYYDLNQLPLNERYKKYFTIAEARNGLSFEIMEYHSFKEKDEIAKSWRTYGSKASKADWLLKNGKEAQAVLLAQAALILAFNSGERVDELAWQATKE